MIFIYDGLEKVLYNGDVYIIVSKKYYAEYEDWLLELKHIESGCCIKRWLKWDKSEMIINEPKLGSINSNWLSDQLELYDNSSKSLPKEKEEGENEMKKEMSIQEMFENITAIRGALMNLKNGGIEIFFEEETMSFCKDELCVDLYHTWYETK
jgi:hypothetical protein